MPLGGLNAPECCKESRLRQHAGAEVVFSRCQERSRRAAGVCPARRRRRCQHHAASHPGHSGRPARAGGHQGLLAQNAAVKHLTARSACASRLPSCCSRAGESPGLAAGVAAASAETHRRRRCRSAARPAATAPGGGRERGSAELREHGGGRCVAGDGGRDSCAVSRAFTWRCGSTGHPAGSRPLPPPGWSP